MNNNINVPKLRFKGYNDPWVQCKLGDLGSVAMNKRIFKNQTNDVGDVPFYKIGTFGSEPDAYISRELFEEYKTKYQYPEVGDILISASGSIGRTVVYQGAEEYFQDSNIVWLKHDSRLNNSFLKQFYSIVKWHGLEGSTIKRLYNKNILETKIILPSPEEQSRLGNFFEKLDSLIAANQRKVEELQNMKKAYLQKIFSQELRFAGFTDPWVQRNLSDLATFSKGKGYSKSDLVSEGFPVILYGRMYTNYESQINDVSDTFVADVTDAVLSQIGDVIVPGSGETSEDIARASNVNVSGVVLGGDINIIRPDVEKMDSTFLALTISNGQQQTELIKRAQGKSVVHLHNSDLKTVSVVAPSRDEQHAISSLFNQLDRLIAANQKKVELLKKQKEGYLQQMFV